MISSRALSIWVLRTGIRILRGVMRQGGGICHGCLERSTWVRGGCRSFVGSTSNASSRGMPIPLAEHLLAMAVPEALATCPLGDEEAATRKTHQANHRRTACLAQGRRLLGPGPHRVRCPHLASRHAPATSSACAARSPHARNVRMRMEHLPSECAQATGDLLDCKAGEDLPFRELAQK